MLTVPIRQLGESERTHGRADPRPRPVRRRPDRRAGRRPRTGLVARRRPDLRLRHRPQGRVAVLVRRPPRPGAAPPPARSPPSPTCSAPSRAICSSIIGRADAVLDLWDRLGGHWGPARDVRPHQPLLVADARPGTARRSATCAWCAPTRSTCSSRRPSRCTPRRSASRRCVDDGGRGYRRRIGELVRGQRAYARFVDGEVVFKAELAIVTRRTTQVQGVWVAPAVARPGHRHRRDGCRRPRRAAPGRADRQPLRQRLQRPGPPGVRPLRVPLGRRVRHRPVLNPPALARRPRRPAAVRRGGTLSFDSVSRKWVPSGCAEAPISWKPPRPRGHCRESGQNGASAAYDPSVRRV